MVIFTHSPWIFIFNHLHNKSLFIQFLRNLSRQTVRILHQSCSLMIPMIWIKRWWTPHDSSVENDTIYCVNGIGCWVLFGIRLLKVPSMKDCSARVLSSYPLILFCRIPLQSDASFRPVFLFIQLYWHDIKTNEFCTAYPKRWHWRTFLTLTCWRDLQIHIGNFLGWYLYKLMSALTMLDYMKLGMVISACNHVWLTIMWLRVRVFSKKSIGYHKFGKVCSSNDWRVWLVTVSLQLIVYRDSISL